MEEIRMSEKEVLRQDIILKMERGEMTAAEGAAELGISERQLRRSRRRYEKEGLKGLVHRGRGSPSGRAFEPLYLDRVKQLLHEKYGDFGPSFAAEKLALELGRSISNEKVRQILIAEGLHTPKKRRSGKYHPRRKRRGCEGDLIQADGSLHDWLEDRAPKMTLITFVDDATSKIKHAKFVCRESTANYLRLMKEYLEKYGRPLALYVDKHSIFRQLDRDARERGELTNFGKALSRLDIELICAHSPQAKGRVERSFGNLQDRLVKEMRLAGICTMEEANRFLSGYLEAHNERFSVAAESSRDAHRKLQPSHDLRSILATSESRKLSKNLGFSYEGKLYQVDEPKLVNRLRNQRVEIRTTYDQEVLVVSSWGQELNYSASAAEAVQRTLDGKELERLWVDNRRKPKKHHPWR